MSMRKKASLIIPIITLIITVLCDMNDEDRYGKCVEDSDLFNCSDVGLVDVPPESRIPNFITKLDLSNNKLNNISFLNYTIFGDSLERLYLSDNHIANLAENCFGLLVNLVYLDLSGNNIIGTNIPVTVIPDRNSAFNNLRSLTTLIMQRNPMSFIKKGTFHFMELHSLLNLDLSHCLIKDIEEGAIDLPFLQSLDLSWNQLTTFHPDSFKMLTDLMTLDLSHNKFVVFEHVPYLPEIRTINLDSNLIEIVNISSDVWKRADSLERLYMRNNDIVRFTAESFPWNLETLVEVRLENNRIQCDCRMRWFRDADYDFTDRNISVTCQFPVDLRGINILDVPPDDLKCSFPVWEVLLLAGLVIVGLVVCFMSLYIILQKKCKRKRTRKPNTADSGGNYTAVFSRDDDDVTVSVGDERSLLSNGKEFDV